MIKKLASVIIPLMAIAIVIIVMIVVLNAQSPTPQEAQENKRREESNVCNSDQFIAYSVAKDFVKKELKTPSTANFPFSINSAKVKNVGNCIWQVASYVDAQNEFGAKIRHNYLIEIQYKGDNKWSLEKVSLN